MIGVDSDATISGVGIASDWARRVDTPGVRATVVDEHIHSPFHNLLAGKSQLHAPAMVGIKSPGTDSGATARDVKPVPSIRVIGVDSDATISRVGIAPDWDWRIDAPVVGATVTNVHVHSGILACDRQLHAPASTRIKSPGTNSVAVGRDVKPVSGVPVITIDPDVTVSSVRVALERT